jgi:CheY-like chemotaxis protein
MATEPKTGGLPLILSVEDDADTQWRIQALLRDRFTVLSAPNGEQMKAQLGAHGERVVAVLMDLSLDTAEDGITLTRFMRATERWRHIPVIAITGRTFDIDSGAAAEAGCTAYVTKPFTREDLALAIDQARLRSPEL